MDDDTRCMAHVAILVKLVLQPPDELGAEICAAIFIFEDRDGGISGVEAVEGEI